MAQQTLIVEVRNGLRLGPGTVEPTDTVTTNAMQRGTSGEVVSKPIDVLNDGLRRTYYNASPRNVIHSEIFAVDRSSPIRLPAAAEVNRSGSLQSFQSIERISRFNRNGRRSLIFRLVDNSTMTVVQQITELTPEYAKVEILRGADQRFAWDSREALSSIPIEDLHQILENVLDLTRPNEWLRLYSFYLEAKRFREARMTIEEAIQRFPAELGNRVNLIAQTQQLLANQQFEEINVRREAGQTQFAYRMLSAFPKDLLETQVRAKNELEKLSRELEVLSQLTNSLRQRVDQLSAEDKAIVAPVIEEMLEEMTIESAVRLDDYLRFSSGESMANESLVALAVGGWLLGPGSGIQNFAVAKSLVRVRELTQEYLRENSEDRRQLILTQLRSEDGSQPELLAKLISVLKPPLELSPHDPADPEGFYRQAVRLSDGREVQYTLQLPPEYDPNRKYPCIVALPGSVAEHQLNITIDYWCGSVVSLEDWAGRFGQATRQGYIVICPNWMAGSMGVYQYTEGEKARILACYRDALRRTSIDTDRAFITGHFEGATAAWDIAQSHPDLWAGAVLVSPTADKYILQYHSNVQAPKDSPNEVPLATYIVYGEMDGVRMNNPGIGVTADRYLKNLQYDSIVVEHIGQGRGLFSSELPRMMQWMQLSSRRRLRAPRVLDFVTMRSGDRFFYWLEAGQLSPENVSNSFELQTGRDAARRGKFEANLLDSALNGIRVSKVPSADRGAWVWLTPEMVDFGRDITLIFRGKTTKYNLSPDVSIMLEDVRQRGDRSHFFWQRIVLGSSA